MATEKQIESNRANAQKSTGPKSDEGKNRSAMNGLKTGEYMTRFDLISGDNAGKLRICEPCGSEQKGQCQEAKTCLLQDEITLRYIKAHRTKKPMFHEQISIPQIATMDMIFTQKLRYAQQNLFEKTIDESGNEKDLIDEKYIYMLMNMMNNLSKTLKDMQQTRATQENIDVAWAELAKADIDPEKAAENRHKIVESMEKFRESFDKAKQKRELDDAIKQFRTGEDQTKSNISLDADIDLNPFGDGGK